MCSFCPSLHLHPQYVRYDLLICETWLSDVWGIEYCGVSHSLPYTHSHVHTHTRTPTHTIHTHTLTSHYWKSEEQHANLGILRNIHMQAQSHVHCDAVCCRALPCVAVCCRVMPCVTVRCCVLQCVAVCCSALQCVAACCSVLQCVAEGCGNLSRAFKIASSSSNCCNLSFCFACTYMYTLYICRYVYICVCICI